MIGLIINFLKNKLERLSNFVQKKPNDNFVFLAITENDLDLLEKSPDKKAVLESESFQKQIKYFMLGSYRVKENTLKIYDCNEAYIELLLETIQKYFDQNLTIVAPFEDSFLDHGFSNIVECEKDLCIQKRNTFLSETDRKSLKLQIAYLKKMYHKPYCSITLRLTKPTTKYLEYMSRSGGVTTTGKEMSQKEAFGKFKILKTEMKKGDIVHTLEVDKSSIIFGKEDEITTSGSLYNFHSHPFNAYLMYKTKYGVPSLSDFVSVFILCNTQNTIVHFVSSLEGLYVISVNPTSKICEQPLNSGIKFIKTHFDYPKDDILNLNDYMKFVNRTDIFKVMLIPWKKAHNRNIEIKFQKVGKMCIIRDEDNV